MKNKIKRSIEIAKTFNTTTINAQNRYEEIKEDLIEYKSRMTTLQKECHTVQNENARLNNDKKRFNKKILQLKETMTINVTIASIINAAVFAIIVSRNDREMSVSVSSLDVTKRS